MNRPDVFVVVDTMVFLKALGSINPYSDALDCIKKISNRIALSTEIRREYKCKVTIEGMTSLILARKIRELERLGKTRDLHRTDLDNTRARITRDGLPLPTDTFDHKFIEAAIACHARYVITTDPSLLDLDPYNYNASNFRIVQPQAFTFENCGGTPLH